MQGDFRIIAPLLRPDIDIGPCPCTDPCMVKRIHSQRPYGGGYPLGSRGLSANRMKAHHKIYNNITTTRNTSPGISLKYRYSPAVFSHRGVCLSPAMSCGSRDFIALFDQMCILPEAPLRDGNPRLEATHSDPTAAGLVLTLQPNPGDYQVLKQASDMMGPSIISLLGCDDSTEVRVSSI